MRQKTADFPVFQFDGAGLGRKDADQRFEQSGFAHSVAAHDDQDFFLFDLETQIVNDPALAVTDIKIVNG
jgi:hypothetical protein